MAWILDDQKSLAISGEEKKFPFWTLLSIPVIFILKNLK